MGAVERTPVEIAQVEFELATMLELASERRPRRILEVGCWHGGTLWHWLQLPGVESVTVIDDAMRQQDLWLRWAYDFDVALHLVRGGSGEADTVSAAAELGPYDLVFIDADHSYEAVRLDWGNYSRLAADGGVVCLHDILPRPEPEYGVSSLWRELKASLDGQGRFEEIVNGDHDDYCGIGVIYL
jgi:predicted O-methyltransferase YrrM